MKTGRRSRLAVVTLLTLPFALAPCLAQDDAEPAERDLRIYVEIGTWGAEPDGLEYEPATDGGGSLPQIIGYSHDANYEGLYEAALMLGEDFGEVRASWYAQTDEASLSRSTPGSFVYGETLSNPLFAGYANDGLADAFDSSAETKLSEFRFDFARTAFRSDSISGKWFVGVRRVTHDRSLRAAYYALSPDLPPVQPPQPQLVPVADTAQIGSEYRGRGIEGGLEVRMPIVARRLELEAGFCLGVLSGKMDTTYLSTTYAYVYTPNPAVPQDTYILGPDDYDAIFGDSVEAAKVQQAAFSVGLQSQSRRTVNPVFDLFVGLRGRVWSELEVLVGWRNTHYGDVGVDLRSKTSTVTPAGVNVQDVDEVNRSVGYGGGYFALAYTF